MTNPIRSQCRSLFGEAAPQTAAPTVINRHHFRGKALPEPWVYIGRGTPLGNPFTRDEHGNAALLLYRDWLRRAVDAGERDVLRALESITEKHHLVCSCAPRPCHGEVIVEVWREMQDGTGSDRRG